MTPSEIFARTAAALLVAAAAFAPAAVQSQAYPTREHQLSGRLDFTALDPAYTLAQVREGRLRILGVSTAERLQANPDLPTMKEQGVDMDVTGWFAAMVPAGTPAPVKAKIHEWFVKVVSTPQTKAFLNKFGGDPLIETPEQGQKRLLRDIDAWKEYARIARIVPQ